MSSTERADHEAQADVMRCPFPPGRKGLPVLGETPAYVGDVGFIRKRIERHGRIFRTNLFGQPAVIMAGREANRFLLAAGMRHVTWREGWPPPFHELLGQSLFVQEGEEHDRNRRLLTPAFHGEALRSYVPTMEAIASEHLAVWAEARTITWFPRYKELTFEVASRLLLGCTPPDVPRLARLFTQLTAGFAAGLAVPLRARWAPYGKALRARDALLDFTEQAVRERMEQPRDDALSRLVTSRDESGDRLSLEELKVQALLLLFAGHETAASVLTSFCLEMARHPEVLARVREEQAQLDTNEMTVASLGQMRYLEQVLLEVMRLHPTITGGFRGVVEDFAFDGYRVPAGWRVQYCHEATHLDPEIWSQPQRFDPDRFSDERAEHKKDPFAFVAFGAGPRMCLGMPFAKLELKLITALLARRYEWTLVPRQKLKPRILPIRHPASGLEVEFVPLDA